MSFSARNWAISLILSASKHKEVGVRWGFQNQVSLILLDKPWGEPRAYLDVAGIRFSGEQANSKFWANGPLAYVLLFANGFAIISQCHHDKNITRDWCVHSEYLITQGQKKGEKIMMDGKWCTVEFVLWESLGTTVTWILILGPKSYPKIPPIHEACEL